MKKVKNYFKLEEIADVDTNMLTTRREEFGECDNVLTMGMIKSRIPFVIEEPTAKETDLEGEPGLKEGDIIIKRINPAYASYLLFDVNLDLGPNLVRIRLSDGVKSKIYPPFLACFLDAKIKDLTRGSNVLTLALSQLNALKIPVIDYQVQQVIGDSWKLNNIQYQYDINLADTSFEYNNNLILSKLEVLCGL